MSSNRIVALTLAFLVPGLCLSTPSVATPRSGEAPFEGLKKLSLDPTAEAFAPWRDRQLVAERFFREDLRHLMDNGLNYAAQFEARHDQAEPLVMLENAQGDALRYPVILSIGDGVETWRNHIVAFDEEGAVYLSLRRTLRDMAREVAAPGAEEPPVLMVRIISTAAFRGYLFAGEQLVSTLDVRQPRPAEESSAPRGVPSKLGGVPVSIPFCCGPNMGFNYEVVGITAENGVSVPAFANMVVVNPLCTPTSPQICEAKSLLNVDYPAQGVAFHKSIYGSSPICSWFVGGTCGAVPNTQTHRTFNNTSEACADEFGNPTLQKHSWTGMVPTLFFPGVEATIFATDGCQQGGTWTVVRPD